MKAVFLLALLCAVCVFAEGTWESLTNAISSTWPKHLLFIALQKPPKSSPVLTVADTTAVVTMDATIAIMTIAMTAITMTAMIVTMDVDAIKRMNDFGLAAI